MRKKREAIKCEICNQNKLGCKRRIYGHKKRFYIACKECQKEMKLTSQIICMTACAIVSEKPDKFKLFIVNGRIFGVTPLTAKS